MGSSSFRRRIGQVSLWLPLDERLGSTLKGGPFLAFPCSREDSAAFGRERESGLCPQEVSHHPFKKKLELGLSDMEKEACRTPSLTKE